MIDLAKLRSLAEKATPGPWTHDDKNYINIDYGVARSIVNADTHGVISCSPIDFPNSHDAEFIAAANPQTILELCDEIERLREIEWKYKELSK